MRSGRRAPCGHAEAVPRAVGGYIGRFAPSPTGPLHAGSLVAALASWLDARAHGGRWLVRIEDIDPPRAAPGAVREQLASLQAHGLVPDEPVLHQGARSAAYDAALAQLASAGLLYPCTCSRSQLTQREAAGRMPAGVYDGHCRGGALPGQLAALRLRVDGGVVGFRDRAAGWVQQDLAREVGDFILRRADGLYAYQLAVVVDDGFQGITDVVRGADLLDNTPRQIHLQRLLGLPEPRYLHLPLVMDAGGSKLSKQTGAAALAAGDALPALRRAWRHLGGAELSATTVAEFLALAVPAWGRRHPLGPALPARGGAAIRARGGPP